MLPERFQDVERIGEGASAWVYRARDTRTDSLVAVKMLKPHLQTDDISVERFRRELQITRLVGHPRIVAVYDLVREAEQTYLVMEYVDGPDLRRLVRAAHPLDFERALELLVEILDVLAACHAKNVIHRDLKPHNAIVDPAVGVRLLDFGIAKMTSLSELTQTGASIGSPEYMAPELFGRNAHDARTDLYAAGIIAFELLAGRPPFQGDSLAVLCHHHLTAPIPSLQEIRPEVPEWFAHLLERLLAKRPHERYQLADEVLADISRRRVLCRDLPSLRKRRCASCGAATLAELDVCLSCGWSTAELQKPGECEIVCAEDENDEKLDEYARDVLGIEKRPERRGRTLLLSGLDALPAQLLARSAANHGLGLSVRRRSPYLEVRKAAPLVLAATVTRPVILSVALPLMPGPFVLDLSLPRVLMSAALLGLAGVFLRRFQLIEVLPLWPTSTSLARRLAHDHGWMEHLLPWLKPQRTEEMKACVASLVERYLLLQRLVAQLSGEVRLALEKILESAAELGAMCSEVSEALGSAALADRARAYVDAADDADVDGARQERAGGALRAHYLLEEKVTALHNRLIFLHYVFNRLVGRALAQQAPLDQSATDMLAECVRGLERDLPLAREVCKEIEGFR